MLTRNEIREIVVRNRRFRKSTVRKLIGTSFEDGVAIWNDDNVRRLFFDRAMKKRRPITY